MALTSYVAGRGLVSWREQRERDRESAEYRHREQVYEELAIFMLSRFGHSPQLDTDARLRAAAALWGSPETIAALQRWQVRKWEASRGAVGVVPMTEEDSDKVQRAFGEALLEMRKDLSPTSGRDTDIDTLLGSIFDVR